MVFGTPGRFRVAQSVLFSALFLTLGASIASAQAPGGFIESSTGAGLRPRLSAGQIQTFVPERGRFTFPAPYGTTGIRITNASDCGGRDCVNYVGYSYWSNINNHVGSDTMYIFLGLDRGQGGSGPTLFTYNKTSGEVRNLGTLFSTDSSLGWSSGEGWYFSATEAHTLYVNDTQRLMKFDVVTRALETVFDVRQEIGSSNRIKQIHSSHDGRVHSATVQDGGWNMTGCMVYQQDSRRTTFIAAKGDYDECQIDKSGRYLMVKENIDGRNNEDNRIIDLATGAERIFYDENGAGGHSDIGYGYFVAEDDKYNAPGAVRVWQLDREQNAPGQGTVVYQLASWNSGLGHVAHGNARPGGSNGQMACTSNAHRQDLPRVNEIVCYRMDGSMQALVVAPNITDLSAPGGRGGDYEKWPKGNLDVTGEYFIWTANMGGGRLDAFVVRVPQQKIGSSGEGVQVPVASTPPPSAPAPSAPAPTTPAPTAPVVAAPVAPTVPTVTTAGDVRWMSLVNVSVSGNNVQKSGGCSGCPDASAVSEQQISGSGGVEFTAADAQTLRFVGLGSAGAGAGGGDLEFAIRLQAGVAEVREWGSYKTEVRFNAGDTFAIMVDGGTVRYVKNGAAFHTSTAQAGGTLRVHVVLFDVGSAVNTLTMAGVTAEASPAPAAPVASAPGIPAATAPTPAASPVTKTPAPATDGSHYAVPRPDGVVPMRRR